MNFENIKVGDEVLAVVKVVTGWGTNERFWIPKKVEKVTPKQFSVDGNKYKKENGVCIGGGYHNEVKPLSKGESQLSEKNALVKSLNAVYEVTTIVDGIRIKYDHKNLFAILDKLKEIEKLIED